MIQLGSQEHKKRFCQHFLDTHLQYEPETLPWPKLEGIALERMRGIPFWKEALYTERKAGVMVTRFAETVEDPMLREAIALQGREESRHARLIAYLINHYGIEIEEPETAVISDNIEMEFTDFGFEECLDSYFAFGMFEIAHQAQYLPEEVFQIFDPILDEEARHIVFFVNWFTYLQIHRSQGFAPLRALRTSWHYGRALKGLIDVFGGVAERDDQAFTATSATMFMDDLTPELFFNTCLSQNAHRMSQFPPELLQPELLPTLSRLALSILKFLPKKPTTAIASS
ncbi:MAG: ferritin-like domain-containing protein [Snowella sp.]|nr:ferritin-like domain-containing protein [Snowella sp.]